MDIDSKYDLEIKSLNVNEHLVNCNYSYWDDEFKENNHVRNRLIVIKDKLGKEFGRQEVVDFYKSNVDIETKFFAAMIWGHEAPEGSKRDTRGPFKVREMFKSSNFSNTLREVNIENYKNISSSYSKMKKNIARCGPSFLTKHLYFLGKSQNKVFYPLIFDNRVSVGLVKISLMNCDCLTFVTIQAEPKAKVYMKYLEYAKEQSKRIDCKLDQIEYFLFRHA